MSDDDDKSGIVNILHVYIVPMLWAMSFEKSYEQYYFELFLWWKTR